MNVIVFAAGLQTENPMTPFRTTLLFLVAGSLSAGVVAGNKKGGETMALALTSGSFNSGADIPKKFTCEGQDASPALAWNSAPQGTVSFALIVDDPDAPAGTWVHWIVYDLPASTQQLPEGVAKTDEVSGGGRQGINDFRKTGYGGPCPPPGKPHRYFFKIYALDSMLNLKPRASKKDVEQAMKGHVLAQAELMGKFQR